MSQPTPYNKTTTFANETFDQDFKDALDVELHNVETTVDNLCTNIALIQRDDGGLHNAIVTRDSLSAGLYTEILSDIAGTDLSSVTADVAAYAQQAEDAKDLAQDAQVIAQGYSNDAHGYATDAQGYAQDAQDAVDSLQVRSYEAVATAGQTQITPGFTMNTAAKNVSIKIDSVPQPPSTFSVPNSTTILLTSALSGGEDIWVDSWDFTSGAGEYPFTGFWVSDFGATGDGTTDDTSAIQNAIDAAESVGGGVVNFGRGTFLINSAPKTINGKSCGLSIPANVVLRGFGPGVSTIKVGSSFPLAGVALMNESGYAALDTYHDANICIERLTFTDVRVYPAWNEDNPATFGPTNLTISQTNGGLIRFNSCSRPTVRDCELYSVRVLGVSFSGCLEPKFVSNSVHDCGHIYRGTYPLYISVNPVPGSYTKRPIVTNNSFTDIDFPGIMCGAGVLGAIIADNSFKNCKEAAIHCPNECTGLTCTGNVIDGVFLGDISAHGIEVENLSEAVISGNTIRRCDRNAIQCGGVRNSSIIGNTLMDNGAAVNYPLGTSSVILGINGTAVVDEGKAGIVLFSATGDVVVDNLLISGNNITDTVGNQKYAISLGQTSPSRVYDGVTIIGNDFTAGGSIDDIYYSANARAALPTNMKVHGNISSRITGPQSSPVTAAAYQAREIGGAAYARLLGLPCRPTLDVKAWDSIGLTNGIPTGWTFSRATIGTYYDFAGVRQTASSGVLRHDYHPTTGEYMGWKLEPARTNRLLNSATPATQSVSLTAATYVLWVEGTGSCTLSGGPTGTATAGNPVVFTLGGTTTVTFTVTGSLTAFQCEAGDIPTSFIPTAGSAVTRNVDLLYLPVSSFNFNAAEGTLLVEWMIPTVGSSSANVIASLDDGTANEIMYMFLADATANDPVRITIVDGGATQLAIDQTLATPAGVFHWSAFSYKLNLGAVASDGLNPGTDTVMSLPTVTNLVIGSRMAGGFPINGYVRRVVYFPRAVHALTPTAFRDMTRV